MLPLGPGGLEPGGTLTSCAKATSMLLNFTLMDGTAIAISPRFIAYVVPNGTGARITLADGSSKDVSETFERVVSDVSAARKGKGSAT